MGLGLMFPLSARTHRLFLTRLLSSLLACSTYRCMELFLCRCRRAGLCFSLCCISWDFFVPPDGWGATLVCLGLLVCFCVVSSTNTLVVQVPHEDLSLQMWDYSKLSEEGLTYFIRQSAAGAHTIIHFGLPSIRDPQVVSCLIIHLRADLYGFLLLSHKGWPSLLAVPSCPSWSEICIYLLQHFTCVNYPTLPLW